MDVDELLRRQDGVISRSQALDGGLRDHEIRRLFRRNEWARVHTGVYVQHTGPLTWSQRAWAAVLYAAPAALCLDSALGADALPIHVAVAQHRAILAEPAGSSHSPSGEPPRASPVERQPTADALRRSRDRRRMPRRVRTRCHCSSGQRLPVAANHRTSAAPSARFTGSCPSSPVVTRGAGRYRRRHLLGP